MRLQPIPQPSTDSVKTGGMWCALSLGLSGDLCRYLGSKETVITSHQASAFTARNPRNPEADQKAALD